MRTDIEFNTVTHDIQLHSQKMAPSYPIEWLDLEGPYLSGFVSLPDHFSEDELYDTGVQVHIPYTPVHKPMKLSFFLGIHDVGKLFTVYVSKNGQQEERIIHASELCDIDIDENYILQLERNSEKVWIWSAKESDFKIVDANNQNGNLLLQCIPSNSYRYPISGVGLLKYLHSNIHQSDLAARLQSEFLEDGVKVLEAAFDTETGELDLQLDFSKVNGNIHSKT